MTWQELKWTTAGKIGRLPRDANHALVRLSSLRTIPPVYPWPRPLKISFVEDLWCLDQRPLAKHTPGTRPRAPNRLKPLAKAAKAKRAGRREERGFQPVR